MLELQIRASHLENVIESIKDLVTDANFDCSASASSLQALDSNHEALVTLLLGAEGFERYRCDKNISMGMNLDNLEKIIKCGRKEDNVTIMVGDGSDKATLMIESPDQGKTANFEMKLIDIDSERPYIPQAEYQAIVRMPSAMFAKICRDLSAFGDTVVISVSKEGMKFTPSSDTGVGSIVLTENILVDKPVDDTIIEMKEPVSLTFSLRYLNSFTKATPYSKIVTISLSPEVPAIVEYKTPDNTSYIRFYLASKLVA